MLRKLTNARSETMASTQDEDMYLFSSDTGQTPGAYPGQSFDTFLDAAETMQNESVVEAGFLNPGDLNIEKEHNTSRAGTTPARASTSSESSSTSSSSRRLHQRNVSAATTASPTAKQENWNAHMGGITLPAQAQYLDDASMSNDYDADQQMASAFDFDTAASTPSGYDAATMSMSRPFVGNQQLQRPTTMTAMSATRGISPRITGPPAQFFLGSREASPLSTMLPAGGVAPVWPKQSSSSGLEETFHHMGMNGDSPGNATFSPQMQMQFGVNFAFDPESTGAPSSFAKEVSSTPSTIHSFEPQPTLHIQPTSLKSRVETQIPIKMTLYPVPSGIKRLRLPSHTVSKPKFLAKPELERSADTLELHVSLVCTSAMQDPGRKQRALARARGEDLGQYARPSPASSASGSSTKEDEEKPLNGGEVRICSGCIQRERKRASRKKQKKPEEEELFQKDEERRVVVFNTNEVKEWVEVTQENQPSPDRNSIPPPGTVQVELPMRIACYCRHQNEKMGFQVIFTVKDFRDKVIAQAMTNSIMITDDHKTHNAPQQLTAAPLSQVPQAPGFPGAGVFATAEKSMPINDLPGKFRTSFSTPDLTRLHQQTSFNPFGASEISFNAPAVMSGNTSATLTPRNLSRPASPSGPTGPAMKRRKPSGSGKLPSGLTMTRLDLVPPYTQTSATMPNTAASSPYTPHVASFVPQSDRAMHAGRVSGYTTSPPTPGGDGTFQSINRSTSYEYIPRQPQAMISAPPSRHPSRPGSPIQQSTTTFGIGEHNFPPAMNQQQGRRMPPPVIHKLVPAEGTTSGGTEVTLLGNGFHQGLEVMFGDTEATTTTFWGEKCLNCIAPPSLRAGTVPVMFKHEHPLFSNVQLSPHIRHPVFTYTDDREVELLRLALRALGKQMGTDDPLIAAQQYLQQNPQPNGVGYGPQPMYSSVPPVHPR